jgi:bleomycin hydrolase
MKTNLFKMRLILLILTGFCGLCFAVDQKQLDQDTMMQLQASFQLDPANRALMNAISNNDVNKLALNRELINDNDDVFNISLDVEGITNQESTGRCWLFAALNTMRPEVKEKYNLKSFEFSEAYLFFWDKLEKANYFLETVIETRDRDIDDRELQDILEDPVPDGGWWNYAVNLIEKYGAVPKELMPETQNSSNSRWMNKTLNNLARQDAAELREMAGQGKKPVALRERKMEMMKEIYRLLVFHFGLPPQKFTWRAKDKDGHLVEKTGTPSEFYRQVVGVDLNRFVVLCDYPSFPYGDHYQLNFCTNMPETPDMHFINVNIEKLKKYAQLSVEDSVPVWFGADVGWQMERDHGIMAAGIYDYKSLFDIQDGLNKADRIRYRGTTPNHAMIFVGADTSGGRVLKWRVENSWGSDRGNKGYWTLYDDWFDKYVFTVIIDKKYIAEEDLRLFDKKPKKIPAWDPLRNQFLKD